jgi:hypothetical protein
LQKTDGFNWERDLVKALAALFCEALAVGATFMRAFYKNATIRGAKAATDRGDVCCKNTLKGKGQECSRSNHFSPLINYRILPIKPLLQSFENFFLLRKTDQSLKRQPKLFGLVHESN